jgi:hypothetical protein
MDYRVERALQGTALQQAREARRTHRARYRRLRAPGHGVGGAVNGAPSAA